MVVIEKGIRDSKSLLQIRLKMAFKYLVAPILLTAMKFFGDYFDIWELLGGSMGSVEGMWIGILIFFLFFEVKPKHIYFFSLTENELEISCFSLFGRKTSKRFQLDEIVRVKYRKRGFAKIWIHLPNHFEEYTFVNNELGAGLIEQLKVEKF